MGVPGKPAICTPPLNKLSRKNSSISLKSSSSKKPKSFRKMAADNDEDSIPSTSQAANTTPRQRTSDSVASTVSMMSVSSTFSDVHNAAMKGRFGPTSTVIKSKVGNQNREYNRFLVFVTNVNTIYVSFKFLIIALVRNFKLLT